MPKPYLIIVILVFCSSLIVSSCKNQPKLQLKKKVDKTFISEDEKPDSLSPAGIIELQIPSSGSKIYGFSYTAGGKRLHPTVVFLHGMPGNERNLDLAQNLRRAGYNVIYFDYRGSWGSEGKYTYSNSIQDAGAVIDYITDSANVQYLKVDTNRIALIGHSIGAGIAIIEGTQNDKVKAIGGISVMNPYTLFQGKEAQSNVLGLEEYISTLGMLETDPETYLKDVMLHLNEYNIESLITSTRKPILVIDEHQKNDYLEHISKKNLTYRIWDTDHAFTNRRIALSTELRTWLDKNLK